MQLGEHATVARLAETMGRGTQMMQMMGSLVNGPAVMKGIRDMAAEMEKVGIMGDLMGQAIDEAAPVDEEEADEVVEQVLAEIMTGMKAPPMSLTQGNSLANASSSSTGIAEGGGGGRVAVPMGGGGGGGSS